MKYIPGMAADMQQLQAVLESGLSGSTSLKVLDLIDLLKLLGESSSLIKLEVEPTPK